MSAQENHIIFAGKKYEKIFFVFFHVFRGQYSVQPG